MVLLFLDQILNNILRSSSVFLKANLMDDVPLFLQTSLALYGHSSSSGVIALSRPRPLAPGDNLPPSPQVIMSLQCGLKALRS